MVEAEHCPWGSRGGRKVVLLKRQPEKCFFLCQSRAAPKRVALKQFHNGNWDEVRMLDLDLKMMNFDLNSQAPCLIETSSEPKSVKKEVEEKGDVSSASQTSSSDLLGVALKATQAGNVVQDVEDEQDDGGEVRDSVWRR